MSVNVPMLARGRYKTLSRREDVERTCDLGFTHQIRETVETVDVWLVGDATRGFSRDGRRFFEAIDERGVTYWIGPDAGTWH